MRDKLIVPVVIDFKDLVLETQRFPRFGAGITTVPTYSIEVGGLGVCFYFGKYLTANVRHTSNQHTGTCRSVCACWSIHGRVQPAGFVQLISVASVQKRISNPHNLIINSCRKRYVVKEVRKLAGLSWLKKCLD